MSDNPAKYEVLIKQYLRSMLDIIISDRASPVDRAYMKTGLSGGVRMSVVS